MNSLFNQDQIVYSMDASSLIEAYHSYPFDIFPSLWSKLEELIKNNRLKMFELVFDSEVKDEEIKESRNKDKPKIPNVCGDLDIECIDILGLMRKEKWIFNSIILAMRHYYLERVLYA